MKKQFNPFFLILISLSLVGFLYLLITDTKGLVLNLLAIVVIGFIFVAIYKYLSIKERVGHRSHQYSNNQTSFKDASPFKKQVSHNKIKRKEYPFKVIEGNKGKKKEKNSS